MTYLKAFLGALLVLVPGYIGHKPMAEAPVVPVAQASSVTPAVPWIPVNDSIAIPMTMGAGAPWLDSIRKEIIAGNAQLRIIEVTEKVADYSAGGVPGQECNRHIPGTVAYAVDQIAAYPDDLVYPHFTSGHYIRCNDVFDNFPASRNFHFTGIMAPGGVVFNNPRIRQNSEVSRCFWSFITFRLSLTATMSQENVSKCGWGNISSSWANASGAGGQYTGPGSQTGLGNPSNPQSDITSQLNLIYEGDETGPRLYAVGGGSPRPDCPEIQRHTGVRNFAAWGGREPLIGCVGTPDGSDPSTNNNGALVAQSIAYGTVDRAILVQQEAEVDLRGNWLVARPGISTALGRDARVIIQDGCSDAGGASPRGDEWCLQSVFGDNNRWTNPETPLDIQYVGDDDAQWTGATSLFRCRERSSVFGFYSGPDSVDISGYCAQQGDPVSTRVRRFNPLSTAVAGGDKFYPPVGILTDAQWNTEVLMIVGNSIRVTSDGTAVMARDSLDTEQIQRFQNHIAQSGYPGPGNSYLGVNILGSYRLERTPGDTIHVRNDLLPDTSAVRCADADGDFMCDDFENRYSSVLDMNDPTDFDKDHDGDGFLAYEESIFGLDPTVADGHSDPRTIDVGENTYENGKRVNFGALTNRTTIAPDGSTTLVCTACIPFSDSMNWISVLDAYTPIPVNATEAFFVTLDTMNPANSYRLLTEAQVDSVCQANGLLDCNNAIRGADPGR